jgi:hypothetical protein
MPKLVRSIREQPSLEINNSQANQTNYLFEKRIQSPILKMNYTTNYNQLQPIPITNEIIESPYHHNPKYGASKYTCSLQSGKMHKLINNTSK